jgi:hypothetical protein
MSRGSSLGLSATQQSVGKCQPANGAFHYLVTALRYDLVLAIIIAMLQSGLARRAILRDTLTSAPPIIASGAYKSISLPAHTTLTWMALLK